MCCAEGDTGFVYEGALPFDVKRTNLKDLARPRTKVMMNVANPEEAFALSFIPNDGVGLARMEFIITTYIKIHPLALLDFDQLADASGQSRDRHASPPATPTSRSSSSTSSRRASRCSPPRSIRRTSSCG